MTDSTVANPTDYPQARPLSHRAVTTLIAGLFSAPLAFGSAYLLCKCSDVSHSVGFCCLVFAFVGFHLLPFVLGASAYVELIRSQRRGGGLILAGLLAAAMWMGVTVVIIFCLIEQELRGIE